MSVVTKTRGLGAVPRAAVWLGFAGAVPFVGLALMSFASGWPGLLALSALAAYAVAILSFMGGVQWGMAMDRDSSPVRLAASVVPALVAWAGFLLGGRPGLWLLAAAFAGLLAYDLHTVRTGAAPSWYPHLRWPLTAIVVVCLLVASVNA